jgi:hypothetical protein
MMRWFSFRLTIMMSLALCARAASAGTIVIPAQYANTGGNTSFLGPVNDVPMTMQTVFDSSLLSAIPIGSEITGITWRLSLNLGLTRGPWPSSNRTWSEYQIELSESLNPAGSLSTTYASNIASDAVIVRDGPLTILTDGFPGGAKPSPFGTVIPFATPYTYTGGNLLVTIRHTGNLVDTPFPGLDAATTIIGKFQTIFDTTNTDTSPTSNFSLGTPTFQFSYSAVPEPGTLALIGCGTAALVAYRWRRARRMCAPKGRQLTQRRAQPW